MWFSMISLCSSGEDLSPAEKCSAVAWEVRELEVARVRRVTVIQIPLQLSVSGVSTRQRKSAIWCSRSLNQNKTRLIPIAWEWEL